MQYVQCKLKKDNSFTHGYIEERGAKVGAFVELIDFDGEFWEVISVSDIFIDKDMIRKQERNYKFFQGSTRGGGIDVKG